MNANLPIIISAGDSSEAYLDHPDNYEVIRLNSDAQTMLLHFPDAKNACLSGGQRMVITNKVDDPSKTGVIQLAAAEGQDILYRGTQIAVEQIGTGETVEFLADVDDRGDGFWRTITSLPEPAVTLNMADLGNHYYIHSNGTYLITHATDGYNIFFPAPCYMQGSKITLINIDGTYNQPIRALAPGDCGGAVIVDVAGNEIDNQTVTSTSTYVAVGDKWYRIAYEDL